MLLKKLDKHIVQTTWRYLSTYVSSKSMQSICPQNNFGRPSNLKLLRAIFSPSSHRRNYSNGSQNHDILPPLTDDQQIMWPSFFKTCGNFIRCNLVIKPYMDNDFNIAEFAEGSKQALAVVSRALAEEDYESIRGLVTDETIQTIRNKISTLSPAQKKLITVDKDDIYLTFPYEIGIMFDNDNAEKRFVEITVVFHSFRGLSKLRAQSNDPMDDPLVKVGFNPEYQKLLFVCNYRFIRELTKGVDSSWTINMINHFMLSDVQ